MTQIILTNSTVWVIIILMKTMQGGAVMRTLRLMDLVPYRHNLVSYFERLLLDGAFAVQLSDNRRLEIWDYHDIYEYADIVEEVLDEYMEDKQYRVSLDDLLLAAEDMRNYDPEKRSLKDYLISIIEHYLNLYDYVVIQDLAWEIELHGYLTKTQTETILRRAGL